MVKIVLTRHKIIIILVIIIIKVYFVFHIRKNNFRACPSTLMPNFSFPIYLLAKSQDTCSIHTEFTLSLSVPLLTGIPLPCFNCQQ